MKYMVTQATFYAMLRNGLQPDDQVKSNTLCSSYVTFIVKMLHTSYMLH